MSNIERSELHSRTGAIAVDSCRCAHGCSPRVAIPSCRMVVNVAHRRLPPAALLDFGPGGSIDLSAVFWSIFKEPRQIPDLFRLAIDASLSFSGSNSNGSRSQLC
jgi:adenosylhomocysteine nucleosidase